MSHHCHAHGCDTTTAPRYFMCPPHWRIVPKAMQQAIYDVYVPGQENRKDPTWDYLYVSQSIADWVAWTEGTEIRHSYAEDFRERASDAAIETVAQLMADHPIQKRIA